jgi:hypothetical protein
MIHLEIAGPHTRLCSSLCSECPQGNTGCCAGPPELDWADIGRVVALGGRDFLLAEIASGNLFAGGGGLQIRRVRKRTTSADPRRLRCVYHSSTGCSIDASLRSATCNYYLCEDAFVHGGVNRGDPSALAARATHASLREQFSRWNSLLADRVRSEHPEGPNWSPVFLDWLGAELEAIAGPMNPCSMSAQ